MIRRLKQTHRFEIPAEANFSPQMHEHIRNHAKWSQEQEHDTCEGSAGQCVFNSERFFENMPLTSDKVSRGSFVVTRPGLEHDYNKWHPSPQQTEGWASPYNKGENSRYGTFGHSAIHINDHVVDFTHRQFGAGTPFPLIEHRDDYAKRNIRESSWDEEE